jgi:hypothetical protein
MKSKKGDMETIVVIILFLLFAIIGYVLITHIFNI